MDLDFVYFSYDYQFRESLSKRNESNDNNFGLPITRVLSVV